MRIYLDEQSWGEALTSNIYAVLEIVDHVFRPCFGPSMNTKNLLVVHCDDHPVTYSDYIAQIFNCVWLLLNYR